MRFSLPVNKNAVYGFLRNCGYRFEKEDAKSGDLAFSRIIGPSRSGYPKFHLYIKSPGDGTEFNLHLDQKAPIYKGVYAHGGEYNGALIEQEVQRIKQQLSGS